MDCDSRSRPISDHHRVRLSVLLTNSISPFLSGTPFGHLPVLDYGDARIAQSPCILRFVAKIGGMDAADDSNTAAAMVDMTADATFDFLLCEGKVERNKIGV